MSKRPISVKNKTEYTDLKKMQNRAIRKRLSDYYNGLEDYEKPTIYSLQIALSKMSDGFLISYNTLNELLSPAIVDAVPNMHAVLALCRYWNLDYAAILAPAEVEDKPIPSETALVKNAEILNDEGYLGTFYGYMYTKNIKRTNIVEFELTIQPYGDITRAVLTTYNNAEKVIGETIVYKSIYKGTPLLINRKKIITMTLVNDEGDFYTFYFDYRHYNIDKLYYRKGIAITTESESDKLLLHNFVLFQRKVSKEKQERILPGLLPITGDTFIISKSDLESFHGDDEMEAFFNEYAYNWHSKDKEMYRIRFSHVIRSIEDENNEAERYRVISALLRLKEKAQAPMRIEYSNPEGMPGFAKTVIQRD